MSFHKKQIDAFRARSRKAYEDCNTKRKNNMRNKSKVNKKSNV